MNIQRQKRHSCELCRSRKLKCSGEKTGCSRCTALSLKCRFRDQGAPGRPRKRIAALLSPPQHDYETWERENAQSLSSHRQHQQQPQNRLQSQQQQRGYELSSPQARHDPCGLSAFSSTLLDGFSSSSDIDLLLAEIYPRTFHDDLIRHDDYFGALGPPTSHTATTHDSLVSDLVPDAACSPPAPSCKCSEDVFKTLRSLEQAPISHGTLQKLRFGVDLYERLITCPVCYNLAKPPRITIQNVLLIGRLMVEVTTGYRRYLQWVRGKDAHSNGQEKTMYFNPCDGATSLLNFKVSEAQFQDIVISNLRADSERLSALGKRFARRQQDRHSIGHEACPNSEGRCWKEDNVADRDPLDICPRNPAAKALTPCFRIVEEVQRLTKKVQDDIG